MNDIVAQIFGFLVVLTAVCLVGWEIYLFRQKDSDVPWLHGPKRLRRRLLMALLLFCVGLMIVGESIGLLHLNSIRHLVIYVCVLSIFAMLLLILSIRDLGDMARRAERHALEDMKLALNEQRNPLDHTLDDL